MTILVTAYLLFGAFFGGVVDGADRGQKKRVVDVIFCAVAWPIILAYGFGVMAGGWLLPK